MITLLKLLELTDSCVVFDAAVAPPIGVDPVVYLTVAHFSRLFIISKSVIVGCSVSNLCLNEKKYQELKYIKAFIFFERNFQTYAITRLK